MPLFELKKRGYDNLAAKNLIDPKKTLYNNNPLE